MQQELFIGAHCREVVPDIFFIPLYMPGMGSVNVYLVRDSSGEGKHLMVDAGCDFEEDEKALRAALDELGIALDEVDFFITHMHVDHFCGLSRYWRPGMKVYAHFESAYETHLDSWMRLYTFVPGFQRGFEKYPSTQRTTHELWRMTTDLIRVDPEITVVGEGDVLRVGRYAFEVIETPGHEREEISLWEPSLGLLFTGDVVMPGVCTNPYLRGFDVDEMADFFETFRRIQVMPVNLALPGHGDPFDYCAAMCKRNIEHHEQRIQQLYEIVASGQAHLLIDIAAAQCNSGKRTPWAEREDGMRWDTYTEVATYLCHLVHTGRLRMEQPEPSEFYFYVAD